MDRRTFMRQAVVTTLGAIALPVASALSLLAGSRSAQSWESAVSDELPQLSEREVIDLTLTYAESWQGALPGVDLREALFQRLLKERASRPR